MKTKFKIGFLITFGWILLFCVLAIIKLFVETINREKIDLPLFIIIPILIGIIYYLYNLKTIDFRDDEIIIKYLFRLSKYKYSYNEIVGFKWKYSYFPSRTVSIIIVTKNQKEYRLMDFDCNNFFKIERFIVDKFKLFNCFPLKSDYIEFAKEQYLKRNEFHLKQNRYLKFYIIFWTVLFSIIAISIESALIENFERNSIVWPISVNSIFLIIYVFVIKYLLKLIKQGKSIVYIFSENDYQ